MQTITTKVFPATEYRGKRIKATCGKFNLTVGEHKAELDAGTCDSLVLIHFAVVKALLKKNGIKSSDYTAIPIADGFVFSATPYYLRCDND